MFFKDLENWKKGKLKAFILLFGSIYCIFSTVIPILTVGIKYQLFHAGASVRLTAVGIIVAIFIVTFGLKACRWFINMLPAEKMSQQRLKYSIELIIELIIPVLMLWVCHLIKTNMTLAISTIQICVSSFIVGIVVENLFIKSLFNELNVFTEAEHKNRVNKKQQLLNK